MLWVPRTTQYESNRTGRGILLPPTLLMLKFGEALNDRQLSMIRRNSYYKGLSQKCSHQHLGNGILEIPGEILGTSLGLAVISVFQATENCHPRNSNTTQYNTIKHNKNNLCRFFVSITKLYISLYCDILHLIFLKHEII